MNNFRLVYAVRWTIFYIDFMYIFAYVWNSVKIYSF